MPAVRHPAEAIFGRVHLPAEPPATECAQHGPLRRQETLAEVFYFREMQQPGQPKSLQMDSDSSSPSRGSFATALNCFHT